MPISETVSFKASIGFARPNSGNDYEDYSLGVAYDLGDGLSASAMVAGANSRAVTGNAGKSRLILGISKAF